jgi:hypothetical protein
MRGARGEPSIQRLKSVWARFCRICRTSVDRPGTRQDCPAGSDVATTATVVEHIDELCQPATDDRERESVPDSDERFLAPKGRRTWMRQTGVRRQGNETGWRQASETSPRRWLRQHGDDAWSTVRGMRDATRGSTSAAKSWWIWRNGGYACLRRRQSQTR